MEKAVMDLVMFMEKAVMGAMEAIELTAVPQEGMEKMELLR